MTYTQFYRNFLNLKVEVPSYRLGQYFINLFIKDETDPVLKGLWDKTDTEASEQIKTVLDKYQWDVMDLPLMKDKAMITNKTTHIHYIPRGTDYRILDHNLKIKQQDGTWELGCSYIGKDQQVYVRPYSKFNETKFVFAETGE